jgi:hypothetical protein
MFDFPNARIPELTPLAHSFEPGDYRDQIKQLVIDLFQDKLGAAAFDANVLGMAHLGSFDLVRRTIQADGLGMLRSDREEAATRYLYRAWKKGDVQGRGLHFLRLYLQLLYPNDWIVDQLEHDKIMPYPHGTRAYTGADDHFLTSRLFVQIDANANNAPMFASFVPVFASILPARFVPHFEAFKNVGSDHIYRIKLKYCYVLQLELFLCTVLNATLNLSSKTVLMLPISKCTDVKTVDGNLY